jgi:hypothetical protein
MSSFGIFDGAGRKVAQFTGRESDALLNVGDGETLVAGNFDGKTQYWDGAAIAPRPEYALSATYSVEVGADWTLADMPAGTAVLIDGAAAGVVDDGELTLTFSEARVWQVELRPPFPWRDAACEVTAHAD